MSIYANLAAVQTALKAPKSQFNKFGNYNYRNCEDIIEAVKPLLKANNLMLMLTDDIELIGDRFYVKATATVVDTTDGSSLYVTAYAREEENKKGMDGSQVTGASSSYARKYALNGLFAIDDTKDSDTTNTGNNTEDIRMETFEDAVNYVLSFGQYEGETIGDVWKKDFGYIKWLNNGEKTDPIIKKAIKIINDASRANRGNGNV
jgi:hypothetical protein